MGQIVPICEKDTVLTTKEAETLALLLEMIVSGDTISTDYFYPEELYAFEAILEKVNRAKSA
jgi:hypothetical protein